MKPSELYEALDALICERVPRHKWGGACGVGKISDRRPGRGRSQVARPDSKRKLSKKSVNPSGLEQLPFERNPGPKNGQRGAYDLPRSARVSGLSSGSYLRW
jgi:hypothetical protein